ncbi:undecaprenyl-phosphate glucose phosphotransferase [Paraburkholderia aspalathi]|uniref:undecaprenyl-phosphate glucose phosphotransferase n=1 Tax=Paraburkholderia nemoris TaxID=2793076 RepID=UPI00190DA8DC|nr:MULTISPECIES: undecaprenyl-phosphate glucose phosphotransferase [Paraburkholderia]MBK3786690.1 undecaprenyl-phosphate glucose phosphotransferase [Paraburkholderia aspalathi]
MSTNPHFEYRPVAPSPQGAAARAADLSLIVAGAIAAAQIRFADIASVRLDTSFVAFSCAFALVLFPVFGVYQSWRGRSMLRLAGQLALAWLIVQCGALVMTFTLHKSGVVSRLWLAYWTGLAGGALICVRLAAHVVLRRMRHAGMNLRSVVVVGRGLYCQRMLRNIAQSPESGFRVVAVFNADASSRVSASGITTFEDDAAFIAYVRQQGMRELWLALPLSDERTILRFVSEFREELVNIRFMPDVSALSLFDGGLTDVIGMPTINLTASPLPPHALLNKEIFDRCFAALALISLSLLMLAIALAIKATSRGPVFFRQLRKGADGRVFRIYKFRTMRLHGEQSGVVMQATRNDARVTPLGCFLRRTSLDELPQFINVLLGDMSVVGPRPHAIEHDELYRKVVAGYIQRYRIKPGITGWAQVNGYRGETDCIEKMQGRVEHDLYYLRNWSFGLDMKIVGATIVKGFVGSNAY